MLLVPAKDSLDVCIVVGNIEKSLDFYQRTRGLETTNRVETPDGTVHRLRFGTSILKVMDPRHPPPKGPVGRENQERGLHDACNGGVARVRVAMVTDPDENIVELVQLGS